ncbi:MAG: NAD(P)/FAD-dependent oxidoreductase [Oligoflexales bacterium]
MKNYPYWCEIPPVIGQKSKPTEGGIAIVGSGLAGASAAYWLLKKGFEDITIIDYQNTESATLRNCGHILNGTVESMLAMVALHGEEIAKEIWEFSVRICDMVGETVRELGINADYRKDGYLVMAIDETERKEIEQSVELLTRMGFHSELVSDAQLRDYGFKNVFGARYEKTSAQAHPVKFRNGLLNYCLKSGVKYFSDVKINEVNESNGSVILSSHAYGDLKYDSAVIAANAYSPLLSSFYANHRLVEPFRGQIMVSNPLKHEFKVKFPHSFDHGYEYALVTEDNRLMLGGWRNHSPSKELGTYDTTPNSHIEQGLALFAQDHYDIAEDVEWEYSWGGIMAASRTGFPFIGPTSSPLIYTVAGFTGHGFSWAHGSASLLADVMAGDPIPGVAKYFNPRAL